MPSRKLVAADRAVSFDNENKVIVLHEAVVVQLASFIEFLVNEAYSDVGEIIVAGVMFPGVQQFV